MISGKKKRKGACVMAAEQMRSEPGRCVRAAWFGLLALLFFMLSGSAGAEKAGTEITGYFEDEKSLVERTRLYKDLGIKNLAFWRVGQEDSEYWKWLEVSTNSKE